MPRFKHYNYDQDAMIVINYHEQLQPGTFEHAVHYLMEKPGQTYSLIDVSLKRRFPV